MTRKHSHSLKNSKNYGFLQKGCLRELFEDYFHDGMGASEAKRYHEGKLELQNVKEEDFANGNKNPSLNSINFWYSTWRKLHLGDRSGPGVIEVISTHSYILAEF